MALTLLAANNAQTVLASGISASATSITVNTGTGALFPSPSSGTSFFKLTFIDAATGQLSEIVHVTALSGDTMTIERGQEGTSARAWSVNDIVANMMTAGTLIYILNNFQPLDNTLTALAALATGANKLPYFTGADTAAQTDLTQVGRDVIGQTTVDNLLAYLGLKTAAKRDVGTAANQIPDMSAFVTAGTTNGYQKLPGGLIVQWGRALIPAGGVFVGYPIPFPSLTYVVLLGAVGATATNITANNYQNNGFNFNASAATVVEQAWMAIGR
ncbi:hypothetical protein ABKU20_17515 [Enterobacter asburiae]|nr:MULTISPECIES: hypothetical protein [Enterobacter cloacae complex]MCO7414089.1 hypothetical protein [Enterobacter asburiae]UBM18673.1 hypothetical protein LBF07_21785 [Enterobacter cloacae complex sp. ECL352]